MPKFKYIILSLLLLASTIRGFAQISVDAALDTNVMLIGDQVGFNLNMQIPEGYPFLWPFFEDTLTGDIEIVKQSKIDTTQLQNGLLNINQILTLTVFDSGYYVVPPIAFHYGNDYESIAETEPYILNVFTIPVDTTKAIMPIKGPISAPLTFAEVWPWAALALAILIILGALIYFFKKKKKREPIVFKKPKPKIPAHVLALNQLESLNAEKLWQRDQIKEYHSRLSDIIRVYIEGNFNVQAMEMTTWEIIQAFAGVRIEKENLEKLRALLVISDLVKFAKLKPSPDEHTRSMDDAVSFVKQTMNNNVNDDKPQPTAEKVNTIVNTEIIEPVKHEENNDAE
jgi:hypothetical protein